jgi:hypothetical protein
MAEENSEAAVLHFPSNAETVRRDIEEGLARLGCSKPKAEWIIADIMPRLAAIRSSFSITFPREAAHLIREIERELRQARETTFGQILLLEIELYDAKFLQGSESA